jgi:CheY-like chemotaxis protein
MSLQVLYLEDNEGDAFLLRQAFEESRLDVELKHFSRAAQALVELYAHGTDLVVLDLLLPSDDRNVILEELRASSRLQHIPVVVLTGSQLPSRELVPHASRHDRKPGTFTGWVQLALGYVSAFGDPAAAARSRARAQGSLQTGERRPLGAHLTRPD